nr:AraC family ligand binding domain-containing protein [Marinicella sp. W31]MDC2877230.1 AraC family ligand binding domain-containing protein [Marinicella sp. W31]
MGNFVLQELRKRAPIGRLISLPRGHQDLHAMPVSAGYEIRTRPDYQWDGRRRGQSPFSVIQYTIAGAGNLRFENQTLRIRPGKPCSPSFRTITVTGWKRGQLGIFLDFTQWRGSDAHSKGRAGNSRPGAEA